MTPTITCYMKRTNFCRLCLPPFWWYYFDEFGQGVAIDFPLKLKTTLAFHSKPFIANKGGSLRKGPLIPSEKLLFLSTGKPALRI